MLREQIASGDELWDARSTRMMQAGRLVPDELVNRLVEERIEQPDLRTDLSWTGIRER